MIRIVILLIVVIAILGAITWAWRWVRDNRVRVRMSRPPTRGEIFILTAVFQVVRRLIRLFLRI